MPKIDPATAASISLAIGQTVGSFTFFLPRLADVRQAARDDTLIRGDVRMGQVAAASLSIGIGAIMSQVTGNIYPIVVSSMVVLIIAAVYEVAMNTERIFE